MIKIIIIIASLIIGAFIGRIANMLYNKDGLTINPVICTLVGVLGGGLGSWLFSSLPLTFQSGWQLYGFQIAAGIVLAVLLLLMLLPFRDKSESEE